MTNKSCDVRKINGVSKYCVPDVNVCTTPDILLGYTLDTMSDGMTQTGVGISQKEKEIREKAYTANHSNTVLFNLITRRDYVNTKWISDMFDSDLNYSLKTLWSKTITFDAKIKYVDIINGKKVMTLDPREGPYVKCASMLNRLVPDKANDDERYIIQGDIVDYNTALILNNCTIELTYK